MTDETTGRIDETAADRAADQAAPVALWWKERIGFLLRLAAIMLVVGISTGYLIGTVSERNKGLTVGNQASPACSEALDHAADALAVTGRIVQASRDGFLSAAAFDAARLREIQNKIETERETLSALVGPTQVAAARCRNGE